MLLFVKRAHIHRNKILRHVTQVPRTHHLAPCVIGSTKISEVMEPARTTIINTIERLDVMRVEHLVSSSYYSDSELSVIDCRFRAGRCPMN